MNRTLPEKRYGAPGADRLIEVKSSARAEIWQLGVPRWWEEPRALSCLFSCPKVVMPITRVEAEVGGIDKDQRAIGRFM